VTESIYRVRWADSRFIALTGPRIGAPFGLDVWSAERESGHGPLWPGDVDRRGHGVGVSRATVSFVLNDDPRRTISTATRERVMAAARELGYVPHGIARALREGASRIVVLNVDRGLEGNFSQCDVRVLPPEPGQGVVVTGRIERGRACRRSVGPSTRRVLA
jgi:Bacterial regulatory proteins, lacI family